MVASPQWFVSFLRSSGSEFSVPEWLVATSIAVLGGLMVSAVPYRSFKELDIRHRYQTLVMVICFFVLIAQEPMLFLFIFGLGYVAAGPIEMVWRMFAKRPLEEKEQEIGSL